VKELRFNVAKDERKALVKAISEITGVASKYLGAPGFAFTVGDYTISANGTVTFGEGQEADALGDLLAQLAERGFAYEKDEDSSHDEPCLDELDSECSVPCETSAEMTAEPTTAEGVLSIYVPLFGIGSAAIENLERLIASKAWILKKMTGAESLPVEKLEGRLRFPWFKADSSAKEIDAYSRLIARLCETAKTKTRIMANERLPQAGDNEKYKARCFLLALDFKGAEFSQSRKILLAPFPGNGSFLQGSAKKPTMPSIPVITKVMLEGTSSFTDVAKPGDYVEEAIVDDFLCCVPPVTHQTNLMQCGEPYSSVWNEEKQRSMITYLTFSRDGSLWKYCGTCYLGETEHRGTSATHTD